MAMRTYSKKKLKNVQESGSETANDVFPNSPIPKSPFSFSESSESEKENTKASKRKKRVGTSARKPPKRLKSSENLKTNHQQFLMGRKYSLKSQSDDAFTKQSPLTKKNEGYQRKTQKNKDKSKNRIEKTQNKNKEKKHVSQLNLENDSSPSIELPRRDVPVTWQEKISMLYPLMLDSNAKASQYGHKPQKGVPTLNVSHSSIEKVEEVDETEDRSDDQDDDNGDSSVYRTTYTYTWVTDNDTQQTPAVQVEEILPVPCEIEDIQLDDIMFEDDRKQKDQRRTETHLPPGQNFEPYEADLPTMNFLRKNHSKILNSTVKNDTAAQNIQQNLFPVDISSIYSENVDRFKVPPQALKDKKSPADLQIQNVNSEMKQRKPQARSRQMDNNTMLMSEENRSRVKQKTESKYLSLKTGQSNEVLSKSRTPKINNIPPKDNSSVNFQNKQKSSILNSTVKSSAAKNIKQAVFPNDISSIRPCDAENFKMLPSSKSKTPYTDKAVKDVNSETALLNQNSNISKTRARKTLLSKKELLLPLEVIEPATTGVSKSSRITNDKTTKEKKTKKVLNSTEIPGNKVKSNRKVEWPDELSTIIPDGTCISTQLEKTPKKSTQCKASTPKKLKQMDRTENKYRKLQPKSSTMLFVSNQEEIGNVIPDMSTIWKDTVINDNKAAGSDHSSDDTFVETILAAQETPPSNTNAEQQKVKKQTQHHFKKVVTSTPSKSSAGNSQPTRFELDISTVQEPSFDEDMLFFRNSTEVNSLEIAPYGSDDDDNLLIYNKKNDPIANNHNDDQELPRQGKSGRISAFGKKSIVAKSKRKKTRGSESKKSLESFTEDQLTQVKPHVPSTDKNCSDIIVTSDHCKIVKEIITTDQGLGIKETSERFTDRQLSEAVLDGSINHSEGAIRKSKMKKNGEKLSSSVPLCPLTELKKITWPRRKIDLHVKILKRKPSITSLQKLPEDVLFLLDKGLKKKQYLSCSY